MFQDLAGCAIMMCLVVVFASLSRLPQLLDAVCEYIRAKAVTPGLDGIAESTEDTESDESSDAEDAVPAAQAPQLNGNGPVRRSPAWTNS